MYLCAGDLVGIILFDEAFAKYCCVRCSGRIDGAMCACAGTIETCAYETDAALSIYNLHIAVAGLL